MVTDKDWRHSAFLLLDKKLSQNRHLHTTIRFAQCKQKVIEIELRGYWRGLLEDDLPRAVAAEAEAGAAVVVGKSVAVESAGALQAVDDDSGGVAEQIDLNLSPRGVVKFVAGRKNDSQDFAAVADLAVRRDVNVFGRHEAVHGGAVVFEPRRVPRFAKLVQFLTQRRAVHPASETLKDDSRRTKYTMHTPYSRSSNKNHRGLV